ncbi:MAG TPA: hypothetical protein VNH65_18945 [Candidatus Acidoferrum sp.]|nr:hypothetical protein [Candidatus Acidoferrum sp.]
MHLSTFVSLALLLVAPQIRAANEPAIDERLVTKIINREHAVVEDLQGRHPIVETYVQGLSSRRNRFLPRADRYFVSQAEFSGQLRALRFKPSGPEIWRRIDEYSDSLAPNSLEFVPSGFVAMAFPDDGNFDLRHYRFQYLKNEFLGELRCLVFDVIPIAMRKTGLFEGRIWVEDQDLTIVRFNGIYRGSNFYRKYFHFDSWRINAGPGLWLPAAIYSEELNMPCCGIWKFQWTKIRFRAQTRFWGYNLQTARPEQELAKIVVDPSSLIQDKTASSQAGGPIEQERAWDRQAEDNVTDALESSGLLAPAGDVEKTLRTVVNNLEVTNNLDIQPEIRCRVLMTSTLESAVVGHTIILSRGLIDVLPNEASLAAILARDLAYTELDDRAYASFSFADRLIFGPRESFRKLRFSHKTDQRKQAADLAEKWMNNSPYKNAAHSVAQLIVELRRLQPIPAYHLLQPLIGESVYDTLGAVHAEKKGPVDQADSETHALPLGSRVIIDPWTDKITFLHLAPSPGQPDDESVPFGVTPFMLFLTREPRSSAAPLSPKGTQN